MIGLATDEAPAMNKIKSGFCTLLKEEISSVRTIPRLAHRLQLAVKDVLKYVGGISHCRAFRRETKPLCVCSQPKRKKERRTERECSQKSLMGRL